MRFMTTNTTVLRTWLASAVLFAGVSACSSPDRADTGSQDQTGAATTTTADTAAAADTQAAAGDTAVSSADTSAERQPVAQGTTEHHAQPSASASPDTAVAGYQPMAQDTGTITSADTASTEMAGAATPADEDTSASSEQAVRVGDSAQVGKTGERLEPTETSQATTTDTLTTQAESVHVRPPEDSTELLGSVTTSDSVARSDTAAAVSGSTEMARDTSTGLAQADTVAEVQVDTTQVTDTSTQVPADTGAAIRAQVDTTPMDRETEVAVEANADTAAVVGDSTEIGKTGERLDPNQASAEAKADTLAVETQRVRPPEDSAEVLGDVTTEQDEARNEDVEVASDQAPAAAAGTQTPGHMVTGAAAVAQLTREGQRCAVVETEEAEQDVRWDLAGSPATMNPCGTGTMTLPRIQTGDDR